MLSAQEMVNIRHYSTEDGLSQNAVQGMLQDDEGYIWLATWNGLEKYDGYTFTNYKSYATDEVRLKNNRVVDILKGLNHTIWCHTYDERVFLFDTRLEKFIDIFTHHPQIEPCKSVKRMISLNNGVVWVIASDGNLWRINESLYKEENGVVFLPSASVPQHGNTVYKVVLDAHGNEWILTNKGCFVYGKRELSDNRRYTNAACINNRLYLSTRHGELFTYTPDSGMKRVFERGTERRIIDLFELPEKQIGITTNRGVIIYDTRSNHVERIFVDKTGPDIRPSYKLLASNGILWVLNKRGNVIRCDLKKKKMSFITYPLSRRIKANRFIHEDNYGRIWVLATNGELSYYNTTTHTFEQAYSNTNGERSYYYADGNVFLVDNQKNIWLGSDSGVDQLSFLNGSYSYFSTNHADKVRGMFIDSQQRIWVADKSKRVELYDSCRNYCGNLDKNGRVVNDRQTVFGADIYCFFEDEQQRIWMGSRNNGLYIAVPEAGGFAIHHFKHRRKDNRSLSSNEIFSICRDREGNIWIGTYGGGVNVVEGSFPNLEFVHYQNGLELYPEGEGLKVRSLLCTSKGIMLAGTTEGLLTFLPSSKDWGKLRFYLNQCETNRVNSLSSNDVWYAYESRKGDIYAITQSTGLNRVTSKELLCEHIEFAHLNKQNGFPSDMAYTLIDGADDELWINFVNHLCKYDPVRNTIDTYDRFYFNSHLTLSEVPMLKDKENGMYVALNREVLYLDLNKLGKNRFVPRIVFTDIKTRKSHRQEKLSLVEDRQLVLDKDERNVSISFSALDYTAAGQLQYAYRLRGLDDEWNYIGSNHTARLMNLPAGDFVLEVKSSNKDGVWPGNTTQLSIHVKPTFWETGWAWLLYILLLIVVIIVVSVTIAYIFSLKQKVSFEQQLTNLKLRFFTDISHELRTPLTLIAGPIEEIVKHERLSAEGEENIQLAKTNTDRMLRLVNQLLDFRKIQNNKMKLYIEQVDVVSLTQRIYDNFVGLARQRNIDFRFHCSCEACSLYTDVDKFEKILFNLLSNAFKYTPDGKKIDLLLDFEGTTMQIKVKDEGNGIERRKIDRLFQRFETLGKPETGLSSGIGLSLVKELVDMLHGSITVDSQLGEGSTFSVSLSGTHEVFESDSNVEFIMNNYESSTSVHTEMPLAEEEAKGGSVLLVEDNEELRHFMRNILRKEYQVVEAKDGKEGLEKIQSEIPDVIISDIMMPGLDGIELLEAVKKDHRISHIPFILLSAKSNLDERIKGLSYGADDYITKPFSSEYLRVRISSLLKQRRRLHDYFMNEAARAQGAEQENVLKGLSPSMPQITSYDEEFIHQVIQAIEERLQDSNFKIEDLADNMKIGRAVFYKKVKSIIGVSPIELVKDMRIKRAIQLLETGNYNISQIAYMCGFSSSQYFSRVFKELQNCTPSEYKIKKPKP